MMLFIILIISLSACVNTSTTQSILQKSPQIQEYINTKDQCDKTAKHDLEFGDLSTYGMNEAVDKQIKCYESVAHKIIDDHYYQTVIKMKQNLSEFIKFAYNVSIDMNLPTDCYPNCGTITTNLQRGTALNILDNYLESLISSIDSYING